MKKVVKAIGLFLLISVIGLLVWGYRNLRDRNPDYSADLKIANSKAGILKAGFAALTITPEVPDRWTDKNKDAKYRTEDGDSYTDGNGNGSFDAVWIAGFSNGRAANGVHDDHEAPDLMGIWGESPLKSSVSKTYMEYVKTQVVKSILTAVEKLRPASLAVSEDLTGAIPHVKDTRKPEVLDPELRIRKIRRMAKRIH